MKKWEKPNKAIHVKAEDVIATAQKMEDGPGQKTPEEIVLGNIEKQVGIDLPITVCENWQKRETTLGQELAELQTERQVKAFWKDFTESTHIKKIFDKYELDNRKNSLHKCTLVLQER